MTAFELLALVRARISKKLKQAERGYINQNTTKETLNCRHHGRRLSEKTRHCKIGAMGDHEMGASQCWEEKARLCPLFELKASPESLSRIFRSMDQEEISIRYPAIGELFRVESWISSLDDLGSKDGKALRPGNSEIYRDSFISTPESESTEYFRLIQQSGPSSSSQEEDCIKKTGRDHESQPRTAELG